MVCDLKSHMKEQLGTLTGRLVQLRILLHIKLPARNLPCGERMRWWMEWEHAMITTMGSVQGNRPLAAAKVPREINSHTTAMCYLKTRMRRATGSTLERITNKWRGPGKIANGSRLFPASLSRIWIGIYICKLKIWYIINKDFMICAELCLARSLVKFEYKGKFSWWVRDLFPFESVYIYAN